MTKKLILLLFIIAVIVVYACRVSPTQTPPVREWKVADSKAYAHDVVQEWADNQYLCLEKLWKKESNWRADAYNKAKVMGKNAGGIPQLLGLDPRTSPPLQIDRGMKYIIHRYGTPCMAWKFHQRKGWY